MTEENDINELIQVKRDKLEELKASGKDPFQIMKYDPTHHSSDVLDNYEELEGKEVNLAGRIMTKRLMGKASFCNIQDLKGNIQSYVRKDAIGEEAYAEFKKYDIGDIIGIRGTVFKTRTEEISIKAEEVTLLTKSLTGSPMAPAGMGRRLNMRRSSDGAGGITGTPGWG